MEPQCKWCGADRAPNFHGEVSAGAIGEFACDCEERIQCDRAGMLGHKQCGWCGKHWRPMFQCGEACWVKEHDRQ